jgi:hypothetical protein
MGDRAVRAADFGVAEVGPAQAGTQDQKGRRSIQPRWERVHDPNRTEQHAPCHDGLKIRDSPVPDTVKISPAIGDEQGENRR